MVLASPTLASKVVQGCVILGVASRWFPLKRVPHLWQLLIHYYVSRLCSYVNSNKDEMKRGDRAPQRPKISKSCRVYSTNRRARPPFFFSTHIFSSTEYIALRVIPLIILAGRGSCRAIAVLCLLKIQHSVLSRTSDFLQNVFLGAASHHITSPHLTSPRYVIFVAFRSKVQRCGADGCRKHFHPWCMSHHSGIVSVVSV